MTLLAKHSSASNFVVLRGLLKMVSEVDQGLSPLTDAGMF